MQFSPQHRRGLLRRKLLIAFGIVIALVVMAVVGAWVWLHSAAGGRFIRKTALDATVDLFAGRLELGSIDLNGQTVTFRGLKLYTPEGELVAEVSSLSAQITLAALIQKMVQLRAVTIEAPKLYLVSDERGLNLSRAIAAKVPKPVDPNEKQSPPPLLRIELEQVSLMNGFITFEAKDPEQHVKLERLEVKGHASIALNPLRLEGGVTVDAGLIKPLAAPLSIVADAKLESDSTTASLVLSLGADHLEASGSWPNLQLHVKNTSIRSQTVKILVPSWPLKPTVILKADVTDGTGNIHLEAGHSKVDLDATWAKDVSSISKLELAAHDVDLSELLGQGRSSRIDLTAKGSMSDVKRLTGDLSVDGTWSTLQKKKVAELSARVKATNGEYFVPKLALEVPGVTLGANGKVTQRKLNVSGVLEVTDLSKLGATTKELAGIELPPLSGSGHLNVNASGSLTHPTVNTTGTLSSLRVATISAKSLEVDIHVPDVQQPFDSDGEVLATKLSFGDTALDEVKATLSTRGRIVEVEVSTKGLGDLLLRINGRLDEDQNGLALSELELKNADTLWKMEAPSHLAWSPALALEPLKMSSGTQRIELAGSKRNSNVDAAVNIVALDLAKLPRALAPETLRLGGFLGVTATVKGRLPRPAIEAKVSLERGAALGFDNLELTAEGAWRDKRAAAQFTASTPFGKAKGDVNVDVDAFINERPEPLSAHLEVTDVDVANAAKLLKQELPVTAQVTAHAELSGTADAPRLKVTVESPEVTAAVGDKSLVLTDVAIEVMTLDQGTLSAAVTATSLGGLAHVVLTTPLTLNGLRKQLPTSASLQTLPLTVAFDVSAVSLEKLHEAGFVGGGSTVSGKLGFQGTLTGTIETPQASVTVTATKVVYPPLKQTEASATLTATADKTSLLAMVTENSKPLLKVDGWVAAPLAALQHVETLGAQPVKLVATLYPLELEGLVPTESPLRGNAGATVTIDGTLDAPRYEALGSVSQLAYAKTAIGSARFQVKGGAGHHVADVTVGGLGHDDLKVHGTAFAELGLSAVKKGLTPLAYPVDVTLKSNNFDLGFFSGITPVVRVIGGKLTMNAALTGTLDAPKLNGDAKWVNGTLSLSGFGNYREIELEAKASNSFISLSKLRAVSGAGWAMLSAEATKIGAAAWRLDANGETYKFPITADDQPVAIATLKLGVEGELVDQFLNIRSLSLPRVLIELPDVRRKDLQNLDRPQDVVILRGGGGGDLAKRASDSKAKKAKAKAKGSSFTARAVIEARQRIQVKSSDIDIELGLSDGFRFDYANSAQLYGEATVARGKISVLGREFVVQRGSQVRFAGAATEPYINVTAVYSNNKSDDKTKVTVSVTGRGTDVTLKVSSEPPLSESEIYTLLATGRLALSRNGGSSITPTQAASVIGSAVLAQAKTIIAKNVPIDVLDFESGENFSGVKLNVGKYLTDTLFLGYSLNPGADSSKGENPHTVRLEYQMSRHWSLEAAAGTAPAAAADLIWTRDF